MPIMKLINDFYHIVTTEDPEGKYLCKVKLNTARLVSPHDEPSFIFSKTVTEGDMLKTFVSIEDEQGQFVKMSLVYKTAG